MDLPSLGESQTEIVQGSRYRLDSAFWQDFLRELKRKGKYSEIPQMKSMRRALSGSPILGKVLIHFLETAASIDKQLLPKMGIYGLMLPTRTIHPVDQEPVTKAKRGPSITASVESIGFSNIIYSYLGALYGSFEGEGSIRVFTSPNDGRGIWYLDRNHIFQERGDRGGWMGHVRFGNWNMKTMEWTLPIQYRVRVMLFPTNSPPPDQSPIGDESALKKMLSDFPPIAQAQEFFVTRYDPRKIKVNSPINPEEKSPIKVEWEWEDGKGQGNSLLIELRWDGGSLPEDNTSIKNGHEIQLDPGNYELRLKASKESCQFLYETAFAILKP